MNKAVRDCPREDDFKEMRSMIKSFSLKLLILQHVFCR